MAWSWGPVTLAYDEEPVEGSINFVRRRAWAFANPRGSNKRQKQKLYNDSLEGTVRLLLTETTKDALQAVFEGDVGVSHINPRPPFDTGVVMLITEFTAMWNQNFPGTDMTEALFDCNLVMVED